MIADDDYTTISSNRTRGLGGANPASLVRGSSMPPSSVGGKLSSSNRSELDSLLSLALSLSSAAPSARSSSSTLRSASAADPRGAAATTSVPLPLTSRSLIAVLAPPSSSSSPTISTAGENLTARLPGVRNPPGAVAADSRRDAREDRIDLADAGSALTAGSGGGRAGAARAAVASISDEVAGGFLLQSRAFRRHANGADLVLLLIFRLLFSSLPSPGGSGVGGGSRSDGGCG